LVFQRKNLPIGGGNPMGRGIVGSMSGGGGGGGVIT